MAPGGERAPLWTPAFALVVAASAVLFLGFYAALPALPRLAHRLGAVPDQLGWVITVFSLAAMATRLGFGRHLDGPSRRFLLLVGLVLYSGTAALHPWCRSWAELLLVRLLHGVGWGLGTTAIGALVAELAPAARRGEGMGSWGLAPTAAMAVGPLLGELFLARQGFGAVFASTATGGLLATLALLPVPASAAPVGTRVPGEEPAPRPTLPRGAGLPALALFLSSLAYGALVAFLPLELASTPGRAGVFFTTYALAVLVARPLAGRWSDRFGRRPVVLPGLLLGAAGTVLLGLAPSPAPLLAAAVLIGVGIGGASYPGLMALAVDRTAPGQRGLTMGAYFTAYDLAIAAGAALLGPVYAGFGFAAANLLAAAGILAAVPVVVASRPTPAAPR